jgi:PAS domain-containing protein
MEAVARLFGEHGLRALDRLGAGILFAAEDGTILHANQAVLEHFDRDPVALRRRTCRDLLPAELFDGSSCPENCVAPLQDNHHTHHVVVSVSALPTGVRVVIFQFIDALAEEEQDLRNDLRELQTYVSRSIGDGSLESFCSICGRIRLPDGRWVEAAEAPEPAAGQGLEEGYCPDCASSIFRRYTRRQPPADAPPQAAEGAQPYAEPESPPGEEDPDHPPEAPA